MSGWIKVEKDLSTDPRVLRMASRLRHADVTLGSRSRLVIVGALVTLWWYADTHIDDDDVLPIGADQVNELVGIDGFCDLMPSDWLEILDANSVKLVDYLHHNGTSAKRRALEQKRQEKRRKLSRSRHDDVTHECVLDLDQDKNRPRVRKDPSASATPTPTKVSRVSVDPDWWLDFKLAYPDRAGDQGWRKAQRAAHARISEGHSPSEFIEGAKRYAQFCAGQGKAGTEFVKQACTFLGPDKPFLEEWSAAPTKSEVRQNRSISASEEWLREQEAKDAQH